MIADFSNPPPCISRLLGCLMVFSPLLVHAEWPQWTLHPTVKAGFEYNDNFDVRENPTEVWFSRFSADLRSKLDFNRLGVDMHGLYYGERYISVDAPDNDATTTDDLSRNDGLFDTELSYQATEYMLWELSGGYKRDQPRSSELEGTDQGDVSLFNRITRNKWNIGPGLTWIWSPQTSLRANYGYSETFYEDQTTASDRSDFTSQNASLTLDYQYTEYTKLFGQVFFSNFKTDQNPATTSTLPPTKFENNQIGAITGIEHTFSETFTASLSGGGLVLFSRKQGPIFGIIETPSGSAQVLTDPNGKVSDTNIGYLVSFNLTKQFEYTSVSASADHNLIPTASGGQLQSDSISVSVSRHLLEHLTATLSGYFSKTDDAQKNEAVRVRNETGRTNYSGRLNFAWQFDKDWFLEWGYQFYRQERDEGETGERNSAFVNLRYQWPKELLFP